MKKKNYSEYLIVFMLVVCVLMAIVPHVMENGFFSLPHKRKIFSSDQFLMTLQIVGISTIVLYGIIGMLLPSKEERAKRKKIKIKARKFLEENYENNMEMMGFISESLNSKKRRLINRWKNSNYYRYAAFLLMVACYMSIRKDEYRDENGNQAYERGRSVRLAYYKVLAMKKPVAIDYVNHKIS